eukprot:CAMPEP_0184283176 /NCGR_PEP_ID=MMETSP0977-20130417/65434_1 /TAXON_ID=483370 /ORGANISM="non described non described, Strain CCMP2097" /LENGTH=99 /DNA_ID=CAMNT_0026589185 /DNA_START=138 /DNA_END=433 /DNA_ORIENTATION=-
MTASRQRSIDKTNHSTAASGTESFPDCCDKDAPLTESSKGVARRGNLSSGRSLRPIPSQSNAKTRRVPESDKALEVVGEDAFPGSKAVRQDDGRRIRRT